MLDAILVLLVVECAIGLYILTLWGEFVFDDLLVLDNTRYYGHKKTGADWKGLLQSWKNGRALLWWTYRRDMIKHAIDVRGWHTWNLALHAINTALMFSILRWWFDSLPALAGALLFTAHPIGTASTASISGRSSLLCGAFYLAAILSFVIGARWLVMPLAILGFKSKEEAVLLPMTLFAVWWWQ